MKNYRSIASPVLVPLVMGTLLLLNALDNPRLERVHGVDLIKLVAGGFCLGMVFGILIVGKYVRQAAQSFG